MQGGKNAFINSMLTNQSDISYNDRDEHSRNTNYVVEILTRSDAGPSNASRYKKVSKSLLRFKNVKMKRLFFELNYISMQGGYTELMLEQTTAIECSTDTTLY